MKLSGGDVEVSAGHDVLDGGEDDNDLVGDNTVELLAQIADGKRNKIKKLTVSVIKSKS